MSAKLTMQASVTGGDTPPVPSDNVPILSVGTITATSVQLIWDEKQTALGFGWYRINWGTKSGSYSNANDSCVIPTETFTVTGLKTGTLYYFRVALFQSGGNGYWPSNEVSAIPGGGGGPGTLNPVVRIVGRHIESAPAAVHAQKK